MTHEGPLHIAGTRETTGIHRAAPGAEAAVRTAPIHIALGILKGSTVCIQRIQRGQSMIIDSRYPVQSFSSVSVECGNDNCLLSI